MSEEVLAWYCEACGWISCEDPPTAWKCPSCEEVTPSYTNTSDECWCRPDGKVSHTVRVSDVCCFECWENDMVELIRNKKQKEPKTVKVKRKPITHCKYCGQTLLKDEDTNESTHFDGRTVLECGIFGDPKKDPDT